MEPFVTDLGTIQLLAALDRSAAVRLERYLRICDALRYGNPSASITFSGIEFVGRDDVVEMKLERTIGADRKILSTVKLSNGALWRRGQLRVPGAVLPEAIRNSLKGRMIEEIVGNPPFRGFEVTGAVQDGSGATGSLRLRCTAEKVAPIEVDVDQAPMHDLADLEARAGSLADVPIDPVAAHVLDTFDRREALICLMRTSGLKSGTLVELPATYSGMLSDDAPAWFGGTRSRDAFNAHPDALQLKRVKSGFHIQAYAVMGNTLASFTEGGVVQVRGAVAEDEARAPLEALGFDVPGLVFASRTATPPDDVRGVVTILHMPRPLPLSEALGIGSKA
jgi:hypothetical protein